MRIGHTAIAENTEMDDELHVRVGGGIDDRLALMDYLNRLPGGQEETIHPLERRRKRSGIIEIEGDSLLALPPPRLDLLTMARGHTRAD